MNEASSKTCGHPRTTRQNNPRGHNPNPTSWTNKNTGQDALNRHNGNLDKAARDIMDNKYGSGNWEKGAGSEYNTIRKWLSNLWKAIKRG